MKALRSLLAALVLVLALAAAAGAGLAASDADAVRTVLTAAFDKPDQPLSVDPVAIAGDYAVADWSQGAAGGRALLRRGGSGWIIVLCAGEGIRSADGLAQAGIPRPLAGQLAAALAQAERDVPAARLALFARFEGLVRMDEGAPQR